MSAIVSVKKEKCETSFKSSIRPSRPISEITTSHICRLKRLETQLIKNYISVFLIKRVRAHMSYILGVKWLSGCNEVGYHEIYQK